MTIYYNLAILLRLPSKYEATGNAKALTILKKISPAVWRHILRNGHYTFRGKGQAIDLDKLVGGVVWGDAGLFRDPGLDPNYGYRNCEALYAGLLRLLFHRR